MSTFEGNHNPRYQQGTNIYLQAMRGLKKTNTINIYASTKEQAKGLGQNQAQGNQKEFREFKQ